MAVAAGLVAAGALGCDDIKVEPLAAPVPSINDRVTLRGQVCTRAPDPNGFPVKVLFLIDRSGSMCITDPPGSQGSAAPNSLCQNFQAQLAGEMNPDNYCEPDGNAHPGRVCAIYQLLQQFKDKGNVYAALVPFDVAVNGYYPDPSAPDGNGDPGGEFELVNDANITNWVTSVNNMQSSLGNGTDYQGAFAEAYRRIADDIVHQSKTDLPRTRYVIVFLTDGVPFPRCCADSDLPPQDYASATNPDGIWPNSPGAGCPAQPGDTNGCFCTADQTYINNVMGASAGFSTGTDRNQNYQIYNEVDQIMSLKKQYDVADMKLHSILTWNWGNIATLSLPEQQDIFGDVGATDPVQAEHDDAVHLLQEISLVHGNGTYQEFNDVVSIQLGALNYTSIESPFVMKNFIVDNINTHPYPAGALVDTDGEGLPDTLDNSFTAGTNKFLTDTDGDGFDDHFEYTHETEGFDPTQPDSRGCKNTPVHNATCACQDTDGDSLSACAEAYLGTDPTIVDSDTDGVPDGIEVKYGMNPAVADDPLEDTDGDGTPDMDEIKMHSDPMVSDQEYQAEYGYRYQVTPVTDGGVTCYNFAVSNVQMVTTQSPNGVQEGYNVIRLLFDQAPQSNVTSDYGEWREACVVTQFAPPTLRVPAGPEVDFTDADFKPMDQFDPTQYTTECTPIPN